MDYCNSYNGMVYHHSQQHSHEFRYKNGMMKVGYNNNYNNVYGHNQHISWNGMHHHHHHHNHHHHNHHQQYGSRNVPTHGHYDTFKTNMVQNCIQSSAYLGNFDAPYDPTVTAIPTTPAAYRSRFGGYQMCDTQQCFPTGDNSRTEYMPLNGGMSRCIDPLSNSIPSSDPRNHHQAFVHDSSTHHSHMRMPSAHRAYDSHPKARQFETAHHHQQPWYGPSHNLHNGNSETINESNHHYYQYHAINNSNSNSNYNEYSHHINANENQYAAGAPNGQLIAAKDDKPSKMHRDRSLSKLVAMNRRLETQMNENERIDAIHHEPSHFESFDYYTDYSETPDSITSSSQYTNNDCMVNPNDTDNNNNVNGEALSNGDKNNCKEENNQHANNDTEWLTTPPPATVASATATTTTVPQFDSIACSEPQTDSLSSELSASGDGIVIKKGDIPSINATIKSPAKQNASKKAAKSKKATNMTKNGSLEKRRKRKEKKINSDFNQITDLKTDTIPLPGFQQAFGSTEIGRFSEIFFNVSGSPIEIGLFESEADTLSPQPWEMGDSLEGPHFSMQANNTPLSYAESLGSTDSPTASNNSYFSDLRASEF